MMSTEGDGFAAKTVELSAGRIHYREAGEGEPLLFVHGWAVNGGLWSETAARLAKAGHRCIVPDLPFGSHPVGLHPKADLSPPGAARLVAELIETLGLESVTVVANDSGGAVSQILVTAHPAHIARLVLTNSDSLDVFPPGAFKLLVKLLKVPGFMPLLAGGLRFRFNQRSPLAYGALSNKRIDQALLDSWVRPAIEDREVRRDSRKFGAGMDTRHTLEAAKKLPDLAIPVLLAWGERDRFFRIELAERLAALIPDSRLVRFEDSLTFVPIDEPERLADEIAGFLSATALEPAAAAG